MSLWQVFVGTFFVFRNFVEKLCVSWALPLIECVAVWALMLSHIQAPHTDVLKTHSPQSNYLKIRFLYLLYSRLTFLILKKVLSPTKKGPYIGVTGFEPTASSSRTKRSTKLSHTPNNKIYFTTKIAFMQVKFLSF